MMEEIGSKMAFRSFSNLHSVPLALLGPTGTGLISMSNPKLNILPRQRRQSGSQCNIRHGSRRCRKNNARLAAILRQLTQYHAMSPNASSRD